MTLKISSNGQYQYVEGEPTTAGASCDSVLRQALQVDLTSDDKTIEGTLEGSVVVPTDPVDEEIRVVLTTTQTELRGHLELPSQGDPPGALQVQLDLTRSLASDEPPQLLLEIYGVYGDEADVDGYTNLLVTGQTATSP